MSLQSQEERDLITTNILTEQDVILDSPVWRAHVTHLEDQIDQFEKWLDGFIRALKSYIEAVIKENTSATTLCKKAFFNGLDGTLIDSKTTGNVVFEFATTLQATMTYKIKMASDLEELLLNPLQKLMKHDLKAFKESKRQFDKILDKYEIQINRYNTLSKQKEPSALREDAFQMYETRKQYVKNSTDHFLKLITLKSNLEHALISAFSIGGLGVNFDFLNDSLECFHDTKVKLNGWQAWLNETKWTCQHEIGNIQSKIQELQEDYIEQIQPPRLLKRYSTTSNDPMSAIEENNTEDEQENTFKKRKYNHRGYLNSRITCNNNISKWTRRWFFLQDGWFGTCIVSSSVKEKGCILLGNRILISECVFKINTEIDKRYCFEVIHPKCNYYLQAETEHEMQSWLWAIDASQTKSDTTAEEEAYKIPQLLISTQDNELPLTSLTTLLIQEANTKQDKDTKSVISTKNNSLSNIWNTWLINSDQELDSSCICIWPSVSLSTIVPEEPSLTHYQLNNAQFQLYTLFTNIPKDQVVIESFLASLYQQQYGYSGIVFITQNYLWFYSCQCMTIVHHLIIPFSTIKSVKLNHLLLSIRFTSGEQEEQSLGLWLSSPSANIINNRLEFIVTHQEMELQALYDNIKNMTEEKKKSIPTSQVTSSTLYTSLVTPVTVQAQPIMTEEKQQQDDSDVLSATPPSKGSPAQGALNAVYKKSALSSPLNPPQETPSCSSNEEKPPTKEEDEQWPADIPKPKKEVKCSCIDHMDKVGSNIILHTSAKNLFELMFSDNNHVVWSRLNKIKNNSEPMLTAWKGQDKQERTMSYVMPVSNPMIKAKETDVIETMQLLSKRDYLEYNVMVMTRTPNLPYADAFVPCIKYCITYVTSNSCRLVCSIGVQWLKSIMVKGMVNKAATKGMMETIQVLVPVIKHEVSRASTANVDKKLPPRRDSIIADIPTKETTLKEAQEKTWSSILFGFVCILFILYQLYLSSRYTKYLNQHQTTMIWRGVYLRDIEQEIIQEKRVLTDIDPNLYQLFQHDSQEWNHKEYKNMAQELNYSRERLGAIRYELLSIFRILNSLEYQLLENEYYNWLSDKKSVCESHNSTLCNFILSEK